MLHEDSISAGGGGKGQCGAASTDDLAGAGGPCQQRPGEPKRGRKPYLQYNVKRSWTEKSPEQRHQEALSRYGEAKCAALEIAEYGIQSDDLRWQSKGFEQQRCGWVLVFRRFLDGDRSTKLHAACFCHLLTCPFCTMRRSGKATQAYTPKVLHARAQNPSARLLHVTLTVRDCEDLGQGFSRLQHGLTSLMQRFRDCKRKKGAGPMASVLGGVGQFEVKKGAGSKLWHPHYHGLWLVKGRPDFGAFQREWGQAVNDPSAWCKLQHLHSENRLRQGQVFDQEQWTQLLSKDVKEVLKYPMAFGKNGLTPRETWEAFDVLKGRTLIRSFGVLFGVQVPDDLTDGPVRWDEADYVELTYRYVGKARYVQQGYEAGRREGEAWSPAVHK